MYKKFIAAIILSLLLIMTACNSGDSSHLDSLRGNENVANVRTLIQQVTPKFSVDVAEDGTSTLYASYSNPSDIIIHNYSIDLSFANAPDTMTVFFGGTVPAKEDSYYVSYYLPDNTTLEDIKTGNIYMELYSTPEDMLEVSYNKQVDVVTTRDLVMIGEPMKGIENLVPAFTFPVADPNGEQYVDAVLTNTTDYVIKEYTLHYEVTEDRFFTYVYSDQELQPGQTSAPFTGYGPYSADAAKIKNSYSLVRYIDDEGVERLSVYDFTLSKGYNID